MEICFICNVTVVDVFQYNHMFVKLFVPCKLMNQTILGFQSAFVSENVFASIEMFHQRSCICFFFFLMGILYSVQTKTLVSNIYRCLFVYFKHRFRYRKICLLLLSRQKIKGVILVFKSNSVIIINYFVYCVFKTLQMLLLYRQVFRLITSAKFQISKKLLCL